MIATGHYVRIDNRENNCGSSSGSSSSTTSSSGEIRGKTHTPRLLKGLDITKDQSYFLSMTHVSTTYLYARMYFRCVKSVSYSLNALYFCIFLFIFLNVCV